MVLLEQREGPPELSITLAERISIEEVVIHAPAIEQALDRIPPDYTAFIDETELTGYEPEAVGVAFYLVEKLFQTKPRFILIADGGKIVHPPLRTFAKRLDKEGKLYFFEKPAQAMAFLKEKGVR